jgi:hypothetical protein
VSEMAAACRKGAETAVNGRGARRPISLWKRLPMKTSAEKAGSPPAARVIELSRSLLTVRAATFEDYGQIAALQIRNGLPARAYEDWRMLWTGNPVYQQRDGQWPIGWVLETKTAGIVGSIGNIPLAYQLRGRELLAATSCAWVVDVSYRSYSMLVMSCLMRQKDIDLFICTTVSSASEPSYRTAFQFSRVPVGTWDKSAFWITNHRGFSQSALTMKSIPLAKVMSYPVSAALSCWDRFRDSGLRVDGATSEIELCPEFDSRFDDFWEELKHQKDNALLAVRTRDTLAWHFRYSLMRRNVWILTASRGSRLIAYAIFDRPDNLAIGLKRVRLVDFQALNGGEKELGSALCWMLHKCREEGIHVLEISGCWLDRTNLLQIPAPYQRNLSSWIYYYRAIDKNLSEPLADPKVWAPSSFDGDASL